MLPPTILVMAKDHFIAALLGALIELSGRRATFPADSEPLESALDRTRADLVLIDCAFGTAACARVAERAGHVGSRLLMFSASHTDREARDIANRLGAPVFVLPIKPRDFTECLENALVSSTRSSVGSGSPESRIGNRESGIENQSLGGGLMADS